MSYRKFGPKYYKEDYYDYKPRPKYYHGSPKWAHTRDRNQDLNGGSMKSKDYNDVYRNGSKKTFVNNERNGRGGSIVSNASAKNVVPGTDSNTGINKKDYSFTKTYLHSDYMKSYVFSKVPECSKNYRVLYDPETDQSLSKSERKSKPKKIRVNGEGLTSEASDPRKSSGGGASSYLLKPNKKSKKFSFKQLPLPKFIFDKDSLGPPPQTQLVVWDLPLTTSEVYLTNFFKSFGDPITEFNFINHPENAVPLGIATFKFQGNPEKSARIAKKFISEMQDSGTRVDGVPLKIALNDQDNKLLNNKIEIAKGKLRVDKSKRDEEEKRIIKRQQEEERRRKREQEKASMIKNNSDSNEKVTRDEIQYKPNMSILSIKQNNKLLPGTFMPRELKRFLRRGPYLFINGKYIPPRKFSSQDIKRILTKYDWARIFADKSGFFVLFNSLYECERCFKNEDGRNFFEYKMYMELAIPEGFEEAHSFSNNNENDFFNRTKERTDIIGEACNMLTKDFETFLGKDIRERIIAPVIFDLLKPERYPNLMNELKQKENERKRLQQPTNDLNKKEHYFDPLSTRKDTKFALPSFQKKDGAPKSALGKRTISRKNIIPMQHVLNYKQDSESEDEEASRETTPMDLDSKSAKRIQDTSDNDEYIPPKKKLKTLEEQNFTYESSEESSDERDTDKSEPEEKNEDYGVTDVDEKFMPTDDVPQPVYLDDVSANVGPLTLDVLHRVILDEEDFKFAQELYKDIPPDEGIKNLEYWAWKQRESTKKGTGALSLDKVSESVSKLDPKFDSVDGAFRSQGYRKIKEADKIEYLPYRRKLHNIIKTVQHESDENLKTTTSGGGVQSSRVSRANNRRFAADITAQKQMLGSETDILNLNALTKRKKPVTFARSAIHNWGLFALEPIAAKEMIIEYVGESIRQQVAEHRERSYMKTGIGSSYLFRIDENTVIDATKKGSIARFINHCCNPSCTAKIIKVDGKKRIVIYALRDIEANEELTYDYKFERETNDAERVRCLCGAPGCKGYLN